jgi:hypothetical protein
VINRHVIESVHVGTIVVGRSVVLWSYGEVVWSSTVYCLIKLIEGLLNCITTIFGDED